MFEYIFAFYPLLNSYKIGPFGFSFLMIAVYAVITLYKQGGKISFTKDKSPYILLFLYVIIKEIFIVILGESDTTESMHLFLLLVANIAIFLVLYSRKFDIEKFYIGLKVAGVLYTAGMIYHLIMIYYLGRQVEMISIFPGFESAEMVAYARPRSFFNEPAALAQAMLPLLFFSLHKKDYKFAFLASFTIFMSTSTTGVILAAILWGFEFLTTDEKKIKKVIVVIVFVAATAFLLRSELSGDALATIQNRISGGGSTAFRISLGFELISKLSIPHYIFGGLYNVPYDYAISHSALYASSSLVSRIASYGQTAFFVNSFCLLIFRYGIIGFILYSRTYKGKLFDKSYYGRSLAWMTLIELLGDTILFNAYYFYIMLILVFLVKQGDIIDESTSHRVGIGKSDA